MACYDFRGQQVLDACRRTRVAVPDEVAVVGVDDDEHLCELASTQRSSVIPNTYRTGYEAAALLDQMMAGSRFYFSSRRRHTIFDCDWSSDVCSSDLPPRRTAAAVPSPAPQATPAAAAPASTPRARSTTAAPAPAPAPQARPAAAGSAAAATRSEERRVGNGRSCPRTPREVITNSALE